MLARKHVLAALGLLVVAYLASPCVCVWRLAVALQRNDQATLQQLVDWRSVRAGLKQDIAEGIIGLPVSDGPGSNVLPPFGASFVSGIAASAVDQELTPQHLVQAFREMTSEAPATSPSLAAARALAGVRGAFFTSPTTFVLLMRTPEDEADAPPMRFKFALRAAHWRLVRAWLPQDFIEEAARRT